MKHVTYDGVQVPVIGFGTWEVTDQSAYDNVRAAIDAGYRHIDTAQAYGNEEQVGRAIADSDVDRDDLFVTTKIWKDRAAKDDVRSSHEDSLRKLGMDHVDLLLVHWPTDVAPVEETVEAMDGLRQQDKTRLIGVSNYPSALLERAVAAGPVATNQVEYHPLLGQKAVLDLVRQHDMFLTAYSPLAHGAVFGEQTLESIAGAHDVSVAEVALAWLGAQDDVVALPRSEDPAHIASNLAALGLELTGDELTAIDALPKDQRQIDPPFAPDWD